MPAGTTWRQFLAVGCFAGIGFTMSLFIAALAFGGSGELDMAKIGILGASTLAALAGWLLLGPCREALTISIREAASAAASRRHLPEIRHGPATVRRLPHSILRNIISNIMNKSKLCFLFDKPPPIHHPALKARGRVRPGGDDERKPRKTISEMLERDRHLAAMVYERTRHSAATSHCV